MMSHCPVLTFTDSYQRLLPRLSSPPGCGFVRINNTMDSGFALLPKSISDAIGEEQGDDAYVWLARSEEDELMLEGHDTVALLRLSSGCLVNTTYPDSAKVPPKPGCSMQPAKPPRKHSKKSKVGGCESRGASFGRCPIGSC